MREPAPENQYQSEHAQLISSSFLRLTGTALPGLNGRPDQLARALFFSEWAVVSHDTAADPVFNYANRLALDVFEMSWNTFTSLPSRKSVEAVDAAQRDQLMQQVTRDGYIRDYQGIRISASGVRFRICSATIWNLIDPNGAYHGQAAVFQPERSDF